MDRNPTVSQLNPKVDRGPWIVDILGSDPGADENFGEGGYLGQGNGAGYFGG